MNSDHFALTLHLLLFLLVYADSANSQQAHYYITPSLSVHYPGDPCLTLPQLAANSTSYLGNKTNVSLTFLQGNHSLDGELSLSHADNFSMTKVIGGNGTVFVECGSQSGRFNISEITFATIKDLHFVGCGGNKLSQVEKFTVEDSIFEGVEGRGTGLVLNQVTDASIARSSFLSNVHASTFEHHDIITDIDDLLNYLYLNRDPSLAVGGALYTAFSNVSIVNSKFTDNRAEIGGALFAHNSSLHVVGSTYSYNKASFAGVMITSESSINIKNSNFIGNAAMIHGGVMIAYRDSFSIHGTTFTSNSANSARSSGGVMMTYDSSFNITSSTFTNNSAATSGGVMEMSDSSFNITSSIFPNNSAGSNGGVMITFNSLFNITSSTFTNNSAARLGGVMFTSDSSFNITSITFTSNSASDRGGVAYIVKASSFNIIGSSFYANKANSYGGIIFTIESSTHIANGTFNYNTGSLYIFNSNLTFSGYTRLENCAEQSNKTAEAREEGGAITSFQSTVIFTGVSSLSNNQARRGGAILATESKIMVYDEITIANNTATVGSGGGISLQQSDLEVRGNCIISGNDAVRGGGIHATSSTIAVHQPWTLQFINNRAENGSGLYLESNAKLYVLKHNHLKLDILMFRDNHANYGGAIYVADNTNAGACSPDNECFIQTLALYQYSSYLSFNTLFSDNTASERGANIFGGLLDRCISSPFAEVYWRASHYSTGVSYLYDITNITALGTISSLPIRVCFCKSESEPDCSYQPPITKVKRGAAFTVPLVAVDQVNHSVDANIISSLS